MKRRNLLFATLVAPLLEAQENEFSGTPLVRLDADPDEAKRIELSDEAGKKYECRITKKGRGYLWASRGDRKLVRSNAGDWTYYVSPEGSGYVKVLTNAADPKYDYLEHVTGEFKTVTYWGKRSG
jgi:hypothetical protein